MEGNLEGKEGIVRLRPLHLAAGEIGGVEVVKALLAAGASAASAASGSGTTPLHFAADAEIAGTLLEAGADIHARTFDGRTPLHGVAAGGTPGAVGALLAAGAGIEALDDAGETPLHHAAASLDSQRWQFM